MYERQKKADQAATDDAPDAATLAATVSDPTAEEAAATATTEAAAAEAAAAEAAAALPPAEAVAGSAVEPEAQEEYVMDAEDLVAAQIRAHTEYGRGIRTRACVRTAARPTLPSAHSRLERASRRGRPRTIG